jgi:hypothetical protein
MKNLTTALLFFCAFNLTNATAASAPGGVPASDLDVGAGGGGGAGRVSYFQHDYVAGQQLPVGQIQQSARSVRDVLYASATRLDRPVTNGDLLLAVDDRSTDASTVHSLLSMRGTAGFDARCQSIATQSQALEAEIMATFGAKIAALQKEMRDAARMASQVSIDAEKIAAELDGKSKK